MSKRDPLIICMMPDGILFSILGIRKYLHDYGLKVSDVDEENDYHKKITTITLEIESLNEHGGELSSKEEMILENLEKKIDAALTKEKIKGERDVIVQHEGSKMFFIFEGGLAILYDDPKARFKRVVPKPARAAKIVTPPAPGKRFKGGKKIERVSLPGMVSRGKKNIKKKT